MLQRVSTTGRGYAPCTNLDYSWQFYNSLYFNVRKVAPETESTKKHHDSISQQSDKSKGKYKNC